MMFFVTSNKHKFNEIKNIIKAGIEMKTVECPEIQAPNLEDVVRYGINYLKDRIDDRFFIEDSGLFIESLNGFPGVYSSYVFKAIGNKGILKLLENAENRKATFKSVIGYFDGVLKFFCGNCHGIISKVEKGDNGFGFDPIFMPSGSMKTFAEMTIEEKNATSHRAQSSKKFYENIIKI